MLKQLLLSVSCWTNKAYYDPYKYQHLLDLLGNQSKLISVLPTRPPALLYASHGIPEASYIANQVQK